MIRKYLTFLTIISFSIILADEFEYSLEDYNTTSPTFGLNVWNPEYSNHITLHYFSSQGWGGWTNTFGQLSNFQEELRADGYENVVIIAVGQTNISAFNSNFCNNSDLPLVMDQYPSLPIRSQFSPNGLHKQVVILGYEGELLGTYALNSGLNWSAENYITDIIAQNYEQPGLIGDINEDTLINVQDIILTINLILSNEYNDAADLNSDGVLNILDVVQLVNMILGNA